MKKIILCALSIYSVSSSILFAGVGDHGTLPSARASVAKHVVMADLEIVESNKWKLVHIAYDPSTKYLMVTRDNDESIFMDGIVSEALDLSVYDKSNNIITIQVTLSGTPSSPKYSFTTIISGKSGNIVFNETIEGTVVDQNPTVQPVYYYYSNANCRHSDCVPN
jgi:hypothetical protein